MITSTSNQYVKEVVKLLKKSKLSSQAGVFLGEGIRMIQEVPEGRLVKLYVTEAFYKKNKTEIDTWMKRNAGIKPELVSDTVFTYMADTKTPQGVLGIVKQAEYKLETILENSGAGSQFLLVLDNLQDPGNLGTIFRTAEAAGVSGIIMSKDCVDIYNPKTIRSTMGAIYRMPFLYVEDLEAALDELKKKEIRMYAAHLEGKNTYDKENYCGGTAFLIGNEGNGLRQEIAECADCWIRIPMEGQVESLNAAIAASVLMFETQRQRREKLIK